MIEIKNLTVTKNRFTILEDVNICFEPNGWSCIIGPNGSGKTTLLKCLLGNEKYFGSIKINGKEIYGALPQNIAYIPQKPTVPNDMSVFEYISLARTPHYSLFSFTKKSQIRVYEVLEKFELMGMQKQLISTLSGGELQRVFIARAITQEPKIIFLDEPTSALDLHHQISVLNQVEEIKSSGVKILSIMHDLTSAALYSDELVLLSEGKVLINGTPDEVLHSPALQTAFGNRINVFTLENGNSLIYGKKE